MWRWLLEHGELEGCKTLCPMEKWAFKGLSRWCAAAQEPLIQENAAMLWASGAPKTSVFAVFFCSESLKKSASVVSPPAALIYFHNFLVQNLLELDLKAAPTNSQNRTGTYLKPR